MGLEGGGILQILFMIAFCLSKAQGVLGNLTWWPNCSITWETQLLHLFSEGWETSYRQFLERHAPGEGRVIGSGEGAIANFGKGFPQGEGSSRRSSGRESSLFLLACRLSRAQEHVIVRAI